MNAAMPETTTNLLGIEQACAVYRNRRDALRALATDANDAIEHVKRQHLPGLRTALADVADAEGALRGAVEASPAELWRKSRTRMIHGVKIGWNKSRGKVMFDDEAKVVERIRRLLPAEQSELLIRKRESVHKPAVYDLTAADLRRLGISISDDCDSVVVRDVESELDRALEKLLLDIAEADA